MNRNVKIITTLLFLTAAGLVVYFGLLKNRPEEPSELEAMKQSIIAPAEIKVTDLTEAQKTKFLEELEEAQKIVVKTNFDHLQSINDAARLKRLFGDFEGARIAWEYANIIRPLNSLSFSNLANLYFYDLKQYDKAEANYLISIANDPDDIPTIRNLFELYYLALKNNTKAEALLLKSIADNPDKPDLTAMLAGFYEETGNRQQAIEYYEKHLEQNPNNDAAKKELERLKKELTK